MYFLLSVILLTTCNDNNLHAQYYGSNSDVRTSFGNKNNFQSKVSFISSKQTKNPQGEREFHSSFSSSGGSSQSGFQKENLPAWIREKFIPQFLKKQIPTDGKSKSSHIKHKEVKLSTFSNSSGKATSSSYQYGYMCKTVNGKTECTQW